MNVTDATSPNQKKIVQNSALEKRSEMKPKYVKFEHAQNKDVIHKIDSIFSEMMDQQVKRIDYLKTELKSSPNNYEHSEINLN